MIRYVINWKQLGKVLENPDFEDKPEVISFLNGKLERIGFKKKTLNKKSKR